MKHKNRRKTSLCVSVLLLIQFESIMLQISSIYTFVDSYESSSMRLVVSIYRTYKSLRFVIIAMINWLFRSVARSRNKHLTLPLFASSSSSSASSSSSSSSSLSYASTLSSCSMSLFSEPIQMQQATQLQRILLNIYDECLTDETLNYFVKIFNAHQSEYKMRDVTICTYFPKMVQPVYNNNDIQILYTGDTLTIGHWFCVFYNNNIVRIYDSTNCMHLSSDTEYIIKQLYPNHRLIVPIPVLHCQMSGKSCGVFAIAFAVSLIFRQDPAKTRYCICYSHEDDALFLRGHLIHIIRTHQLSPFPNE